MDGIHVIELTKCVIELTNGVVLVNGLTGFVNGLTGENGVGWVRMGREPGK